jgi:hypothetical protein
MPSVQEQWDQIKTLARDVALTCSRRKSEWRKRLLLRLQRKRNKMLRDSHFTSIVNFRLPVIEQLISNLQQETASVSRLRAGKHWRENGEISAGYLKRTIESRQVKRSIPPLQHPVTLELCHSTSAMNNAASAFYSTLYTPSPIDDDAVQQLTSNIRDQDRISPDFHPILTSPFTQADIINGAARCPRKSSPGTDGLPYEILSLILEHDNSAKLAVKVYHEALDKGIFPVSWLSTGMCLLPKKGDLSLLKNWRPISLINTDAKVFTRLINARLMPHFSRLISPQQLGFMPGRFIAEHGMTVQTIKMLASHQQSTAIGLLLDQEKAYDRVHPTYLSTIMSRFGIPNKLIHCITNLFFSTQIQININGHITQSPIIQQRGLRQGDPLSPLLFNIAFDPFLRSISQDNHFTGFNVHDEAPPSYSDDLTPSLSALYNPSPTEITPVNTSIYTTTTCCNLGFIKKRSIAIVSTF